MSILRVGARVGVAIYPHRVYHMGMSSIADHPIELDLPVEGMTCGSCAARVQRKLERQDGVSAAEVNFATGKAHLTLTQAVDLSVLRAAVEDAGYHVPDEIPDDALDAESVSA